MPVLDTATAETALALPTLVAAKVIDAGATEIRGAGATFGFPRYAAMSSAF